MKIKADKAIKSKESKLHKVKKGKNDISKPKEKKTGSAATSAVTAHTFAEKKVLSVKKKNKKDKLVEAIKVHQPAATLKVSKEEKVKKQNNPSKKDDKKTLKQDVPVQLKDSSVKSTRKRKWKKKPKKEQAPPENKTASDETLVPEALFSKKTIQSALKACKKALDDGFDKKKNLFGEDLKYGLQIASVKIPDAPSRNCRVQLPHPIYHKGDDICLIVKDITRGSKQDHEETLNYWQDKLGELGVDFITQVIPFQQLKQDYRQYEMKTKLVHRFDRFLVDARINGHVFNFLGTGFIRRCKNPTPVILDKDEKIVKSLEKALGRFTYKRSNTGRICEIQFATHKMPLEKAVENAVALVETLKTQFPGGWLNIRTIYLKPMVDIQLTFPLYVSKIDPNLVPVPSITGPRERFEKNMNEQLLQITKNKYKFQTGDLVRVPFEQRRTMIVDGAEENDACVTIEDEAEQNSDDEVRNTGERASDTEQSDLGDDDDN